MPVLLFYVKERIDERRDRPGQFLLTGSQDLLLIAQVAESLAGRAAVLRLLPLSRGKPRGADCLRPSSGRPKKPRAQAPLRRRPSFGARASAAATPNSQPTRGATLRCGTRATPDLLGARRPQPSPSRRLPSSRAFSRSRRPKRTASERQRPRPRPGVVTNTIRAWLFVQVADQLVPVEVKKTGAPRSCHGPSRPCRRTSETGPATATSCTRATAGRRWAQGSPPPDSRRFRLAGRGAGVGGGLHCCPEKGYRDGRECSPPTAPEAHCLAPNGRTRS